MHRNRTSFTAAAGILLSVVSFAGSHAAFASPEAENTGLTSVISTAYEDVDQSLVGKWVFVKGDAGATYRITLILRGNGGYTKTLETNIGAGGTHSGTWTSEGTVVHLSGDGNWPAYSHDLAQFQKVE
jgi:hypothetical protein